MSLKPCPFCGNEVRVCEIDNHFSGTGVLMINCCISMVERFITSEHIRKNSVDSVDKAKVRLIKQWNKRV